MTTAVSRTLVRAANSYAFKSRLMMSAATLAALSLASAAKADEIGAIFRESKFSGLSEGTFIPDRDMPLTSVDGFIPLIDTGNTLFFSDVSGAIREGDAQGSLALGLRTDAGAGWVLGAWASYDRERSALSGEAFDGVAFGVEAFNDRFDMRLRAVLPDPTDMSAASSKAEFVGWGENTKVRTHWEKALAGVETEFGWRAFSGAIDGFDLRVYAGLYSFSGDGVAITGTKTGFESRIADLALFGLDSRLSLSGEIAYDEERDATGYFGLHLEIPFADDGDDDWEYDALPLFETRLRQSLNSFTMTTTDRLGTGYIVGGTDRVRPKGCEPNPRKGITCEKPLTLWYADAQGDGDGSFANPTSIFGAPRYAGPNGVIVAVGNAGDIDVEKGIFLQDGQYLVGGGTRLKVSVTISGQAHTFDGTTQGTRGKLFSDGPAILATLADNNWVENLDFYGGNTAIYGRGIAGGTFKNIDIHAGDSNGIYFRWGYGDPEIESAHFVFDDVTISDRDYQIMFTVGDPGPSHLDIDVSDSEFHGGRVGIFLRLFADVDADVTLNDNVFDTRRIGLWLESRYGADMYVTGDNNDFVDAGEIGVLMQTSGAGSLVDVDLTDSYFDGNTFDSRADENSGGVVNYDFN